MAFFSFSLREEFVRNRGKRQVRRDQLLNGDKTVNGNKARQSKVGRVCVVHSMPEETRATQSKVRLVLQSNFLRRKDGQVL